MTAASPGELLDAAADRLGHCEKPEIQGRSERAEVAATAQADLLIVARDGDRALLRRGFALEYAGYVLVGYAAREIRAIIGGRAFSAQQMGGL
jgi:hypothetical protein